MADRGSDRLEPDDLIQDREVENAQGDLLAHSHIADQLHDVVLSVPTPTNIAVWGPWGSGKSGIANLLRGLLEAERHVHFVRFDAFKYAENPLRRNFISAVAAALGVKDPRFHEELYGDRVTAKLQFEGRDMQRLAKTFAQMFSVVVAFFGVVMALLAWLRGGAFRPTFADMATDALKAGLAPAALLTSLAVLVSRTLTREHKTEAADSDEQFEKLFADLVSRSRVRRLVVFVDELDRCAPSDVVATLDALRTFLGVDRCVFIVAADQQVLEEALTRALAQATPADTVNPYYSSGSGYLDKVFQYQVSLPPLLVPKVSGFAADLVRGRAGVWAKVDVNLIVSILVPSHVRSPRRVKALLNTFALTYRLAERRAAEGLLETDPATRAEEIAKLVCLRVEFPLFARDLLLDHRLCEYVLLLDADPAAQLGAHVREQVREAVRRYACLDADVDRQLSALPPADGRESEMTEVRRHHGRQLVAYLKRTRKVPGPGRDLIFLETSGSIFGLPAALAETLEQQAQNADLDLLLSAVGGLPIEERSAVLALLTQQARDAIGLEEENIAQAVLAICGDATVPLEGQADASVETLAPILTHSVHELPEEVLSGCWRLALASDRPAALEMRSIVLGHSALEADASLAAAVMSGVVPALAASSDRVRQLVCKHLLGADQEMADMLATLSARDAATVMTVVGPDVTKELQNLVEAHEEWARAQADPPSVGTATPAVTSDSVPEPMSPSVVLERLEGLLRPWCEGSAEAAHVIVGVLLALEGREGRDIVQRHTATIPPVQETALARTVLSSTARRDVSEWSQWLGILHAQVSVDDVEIQLIRLLRKLWTEASKAASPLDPAVVAQAADSFMRLFDDRPQGRYPEITPIALQSLSAPSNDEEATEQMRLLRAGRPLENSGLLDHTALIQHQSAALVELLTEADEPEVGEDGALLVYIGAVLSDCLQNLGSPASDALSAEEARDLAHAVEECEWLPEPNRTRLRIRARSLLVMGDVETAGLSALPSASDMAAYARRHSSHADEALAEWLSLEQPSGVDLLSAVSARLRHQTFPQSDVLLQAIATRLAALSAEEQADFWRTLLAGPGTRIPDQMLTKAGWPLLPDAHAAELLAERYAQTAKNPDRRAVLDLWRSASLTSPAARRQLIHDILLPMLEVNQGAAELALVYLPQVMDSVPTGVRTSVRAAVEASSKKWPALEQRGTKALKAVGYTTERTGLLKLRERISRSNDDR
ncbi:MULTISPECIES: P-loop NTPase fold protein [unclassified Streptomyces]|uniref:P-loop NTPase fold protein n=1 Tax=unclassified Streptomyces TaxID=2593676 RepID=UPI0033A46B93